MKLQTRAANRLPQTVGIELGLVDQSDYLIFHLFFNNFCFNLYVNNLTWELETPGTWELLKGTTEPEVPGTSELGNFGTRELTLGCPVILENYYMSNHGLSSSIIVIGPNY